jgi:hypothetical protein
MRPGPLASRASAIGSFGSWEPSNPVGHASRCTTSDRGRIGHLAASGARRRPFERESHMATYCHSRQEIGAPAAAPQTPRRAPTTERPPVAAGDRSSPRHQRAGSATMKPLRIGVWQSIAPWRYRRIVRTGVLEASVDDSGRGIWLVDCERVRASGSIEEQGTSHAAFERVAAAAQRAADATLDRGCS